MRGAALVLAAASIPVLIPAALAATIVPVTAATLTTFGVTGGISPTVCTIVISKDTYVDEPPPHPNAGTAVDLFVAGGAGVVRRTLVEADLSGCGIPPTARVSYATLRLWLAGAPASSRTHEARRVTSSWAEGSVNWPTQPAVAGVTGTAVTGTTSGAWVAWTVSSDVQSFHAGTAANHGWRLSDASEATAASARYTSSDDAAAPTQHPQLVVGWYP